ncbi:SDR family NAD(P)-dependent oxidoreductase [Agromyces aerolatus]|uniref:SDR family NAD(P)-dependent oxidoreductase n=1 Tax=Agromyces sp. LY-1074 TaxID=3074080 RepID=UPI00286287D9|nr:MULTISPECIES: SDR family NAD(P)-dependent oxidoreductase [unclassified Agromyces]MDR5699124.1 SDR family NAD(P)-dependent oxidoreductase [Agromyces sp. LY-1074]MDR5705097.1 SDR family NAD(P)-dependent oxidoreductase [Agromyces sp. LY-1358]
MTDHAAFAEKYGPWAVVVGGSEGIGSAFANELAHRGINPILVARTQATLDEAASEIRAANPGAEVRTLAVDLSVPEGAEQVIAATEGLEVGALVYNVGSEPNYGQFIEHDWEMLAGRLQRNYVSKARLVHHFARLMAPRGRGALVLMGSVAGFGGSPGFALYAASKAFSHTLGEALWFELGQRGIDVLTPVVGQTNTPTMVKAYGRVDGAAEPADIAREALDQVADGPIWIEGKVQELVQGRIAADPAERVRTIGERAARLAAGNPVGVS